MDPNDQLKHLSEPDRREAERLLRELDRAFERNPLNRFIPHPKQSVFLEALDPIKMFAGGNRAGKTTVGVIDDLIQCVDRECLPDRLKRFKSHDGAFFCRIVTPDFTSTMEGVIFQKLREWVPKDQLLGGAWSSAYDKQLRKLRFKNGSWMDFLTYEQDLDKFGGAALHRVHFDEEPPGEKGRQIYNESRMRLIDYGGQVMFTMTPLLGMSWTFDTVYEKRHEDGITVVQADMDDNPHLNQEAKEQILADLTDAERKARKQGLFVHFAGLVFDEFTQERVVKPPDPEHLWSQNIVVSIDPGIRFTGVTFHAFDNDNCQLVFDEFKVSGWTVEEICAEIRRLEALWGDETPLRPDFYVIDPSARNRVLTNAQQVEDEFARNGIACVHGQNAVEAGVFQMKRRFQMGMLLISEDCKELIRELGRYRIDPKADGAFAVVKQDDHLIDSVRYASMSRAWAVGDPPPPRRRSFDESWPPTFQTNNHPLGAMT